MSLIMQIELFVPRLLHRLIGGMSEGHAVAAAFQHHFHPGAGVVMVVDHEQPRRAFCLPLFASIAGARCDPWRLRQRLPAPHGLEQYDKSRCHDPFPCALDRDAAADGPRPWLCEIASPSPRPPKRRVIELCPCSKALKIFAIFSVSIPMPVSLVRISICVRRGLDVSMVIRPCAGVNFTLFLIRFQKTCCKSRRVAVRRMRYSARSRNSKLRFFREDFFPANFVGALQDLVDAYRLEAELELALRDAGDVEKVVDQARLQLDVATDDRERVRTSGESGALASSSPTMAMTGESGLRNSCESRARNWSLAAFAPINSWRRVTSRVLSSTR